MTCHFIFLFLFFFDLLISARHTFFFLQSYADALEQDYEDYGILRQLYDPARHLLKAIVSGAPVDVLDDLFKQGALLYEREPLTGNSAIHEALYHDNAVALRWLLEKGLPWWMTDIRHKCAIEYHKGSRCWNFLMRWALEYGEYRGEQKYITMNTLHHSSFDWSMDIDYARLSRAFVDDTNKYQSHPIDIIPKKNNTDFLQSPCEYITQDDGVSKDFVMRTRMGKDRVMMLWERPISVFCICSCNIHSSETPDLIYARYPCQSGTNCKGLNG